MKDNLSKKYFIRILITALTILVGALVANQSIEIPDYALTIVYLMLVCLIPFAVWNFNKKMKSFASIKDIAVKQRNIVNANMVKMILIYIPTLLCSITYFAQPTQSTLSAAIISLLLFVLFAKPEYEAKEK